MKKAFGRKKSVSKTMIKIIVIIVVIGVVGVGGYFANELLVSKDLRETIQEKDKFIAENKKTVFVTMADIKKGETITVNNLVATDMLLADDNYVLPEDLDAVAVIDIKAGTPVTKQMITKETIEKDTREVEFTAVNLMTNLHVGDVVDIRITYPNGQDYLVLSKKPVKNVFLTAGMFFSWLNEEEILRFSSAMVDAYLVTGTKLYAVKYVESNIQEEAIPTYLVRQEVIDVIKNDPNIVSVAEQTLSAQARADLDTRLSTIDPSNAEKIRQQQSQETMNKQQAIIDGANAQDNGIYGDVGDSSVTEPSSTPTEPTDTINE